MLKFGIDYRRILTLLCITLSNVDATRALSYAHHLKTNGQDERINQTVKKALIMQCNK